MHFQFCSNVHIKLSKEYSPNESIVYGSILLLLHSVCKYVRGDCHTHKKKSNRWARTQNKSKEVIQVLKTKPKQRQKAKKK